MRIIPVRRSRFSLSFASKGGEALADPCRGRPSSWAILLFLLGAFGFLYCQLFLPNGTPIFMPADHWIFLEQARQMLEGRVLYRDIFQFTFPGAEAVYAALLKVFGLKVWIPNAVLIALGVALAWLTTAISKSLLSGYSALLPASLLLSLGFLTWHIATHHWFSTLAAVAALLVMMNGRSAVRLTAAGGLCGLSVWFTQTQGGAALAGIALFLVWEGRQKKRGLRQVLSKECMLAVAFTATVVATSVYFVWKAGLERFLSLTAVYALKYFPSDKASNSYHVYMANLRQWQWWEAWPQAFLNVAVPAVYLLFLAVYRRRRERLSAEEKERLVLVAVFGVCLLVAAAPAPSSTRLCAISPPALVLLVWLLGSGQGAYRTGLKLLWFAVLLCTATVISTTARRERVGLAYLDLPTGRAAFLDHVWFQEYHWLRDHTAPGEYFFGGRNGYYYFPLELDPPSDVIYVTATNFTRPSQVVRLLAGLESHQVRFIIWQNALDRPRYYNPAGDHLGPLRAYVRSRYRPCITFSATLGQLLERK